MTNESEQEMEDVYLPQRMMESEQVGNGGADAKKKIGPRIAQLLSGTELEIKEKMSVIKLGIAYVLFVAIIAWLFGLFFALVVIPLSTIALFLFAYFYLAPRGKFFGSVGDAQAIVIDKGGGIIPGQSGQFDRLEMAWKGFIFETQKSGR